MPATADFACSMVTTDRLETNVWTSALNAVSPKYYQAAGIVDLPRKPRDVGARRAGPADPVSARQPPCPGRMAEELALDDHAHGLPVEVPHRLAAHRLAAAIDARLVR
jgi:hypothetical protein